MTVGTHTLEFMGTGDLVGFLALQGTDSTMFTLTEFKLEAKSFTPQCSTDEAYIKYYSETETDVEDWEVVEEEEFNSDVMLEKDAGTFHLEINSLPDDQTENSIKGLLYTPITTIPGYDYVLTFNGVDIERSNVSPLPVPFDIDTPFHYLCIVTSSIEDFENQNFLGMGTLGSCCDVTTVRFTAQSTTTMIALFNEFNKIDPLNPATTSLRIDSITVRGYEGTTVTRNTTFAANKYRFGFNGKENINEVYGKGNLPDLGDRMEDVRLCRFFTTDRRQREYPWQSPYAYYANSPIAKVDANGEGADDPQTYTVAKGDNLTKISKKFGVSISDLKSMNKIKDINKIYSGQVLRVNPEMEFTNNPRGGSKNPDKNTADQIVSMDNIYNVGTGYVLGSGSDNMVVSGGKAIETLKSWDEVANRVNQGISQLKADGKFQPGEAFVTTFVAPTLPTYIVNQLYKYALSNGYYNPVQETIDDPIHPIGSFDLSVRVNADGQTATICLYDYKSIRSLSDGNIKESNKGNTNTQGRRAFSLTNQYFRFIWEIKLK